MSRKTGTVRLHRVLRAPATRVYKAFTDKSALERWLPPFGFTGTIHEIHASWGQALPFAMFSNQTRTGDKRGQLSFGLREARGLKMMPMLTRPA